MDVAGFVDTGYQVFLNCLDRWAGAGQQLNSCSTVYKEYAMEGVCDITCIDERKVASVRERSLPDHVLAEVAETFKTLGDGTRVRIIHALSLEELCVCDIASLLATTKSAVSHQLRILRAMKIVRFRKEGKIVRYSLDDGHIEHLFAEALSHVLEQRQPKGLFP
jgi:DNA-binding transcriptional ArsR family regulator